MTLSLIRKAEKDLKNTFEMYEDVAYQNQEKIIKVYNNKKLRDYHFHNSSGYGYGDQGRDLLEEIYAEIFNTEDAIVRTQIVSGTHAITACLMGLLSPDDELISLTGKPYDTLQRVIGSNSNQKGTLVDKGIKYSELNLTPSGAVDYNAIDKMKKNPNMILIQRSKGYSLRPSLTVAEISEIIKAIRIQNKKTIIMVDNCYGEFTDIIEPSDVGADIIAGSLIKNPGGGLVPCGGYIAGKQDLIEQISYHITAPGLGKSLGASLVNHRLLFQGLFIAPHIVLQALKGASLLAYIFELLGYELFPKWNEKRGDIVQAISLNSIEKVLLFAQTVQSNSPVDSDITLEYGDMPGYEDKIIMAAGTFIQGSSIEISCDAPLREPYSVYYQGGLTYEHCRYVVNKLLESFTK